MKFISNSEINRSEWQALSENNANASPFQSTGFFDFYNSMEGMKAEVFAVSDKTGLVALVVVAVQKEKGLKAVFSKRGIIYSGPMMRQDAVEPVTLLFKKVAKYYRNKLIYLETRNGFDYSSLTDDVGKIGWKLNPHLNVIIDVKDLSVDDLLSKMKYNRRREIRLSFKEGAHIVEAESAADVQSLYQIVKDLYDSRVKLPLPNLNFFKKLWESPIGKVFIVKHDEKVIGGAFCFVQDNVSISTMYYAGIRDYNKKIFPTHLAIMGALDFAVNTNLKRVDLMGAGKPGEEYGVRKYKMEFGGQLVDHGRFIKILKPLLYNIGVWGVKRIQKRK
jgi:lipid II:glycine glycyltransferase (peptidoglycan interpeptide bridge formation enzyme)